jgi:hypothetical protein
MKKSELKKLITELKDQLETLEIKNEVQNQRLQRFEESQEWWLKDNARLLRENNQYKFQIDLNDAIKKTEEFKKTNSETKNDK